MKYSDEQRLQKIYEKGSMLLEYIREHDVKKDDLMNDTALLIISRSGKHCFALRKAPARAKESSKSRKESGARPRDSLRV